MNAQLKVLTYNICALPNWLNQFSNPKKRIAQIISFIKIVSHPLGNYRIIL